MVSDKQEYPGGGLKEKAGKPPLSFVPFDALGVVATVFEHGSRKYGRNNWAKGLPLTDLLEAALRHLGCVVDGQMNDPETKLPHVAHACCNCLMFLALSLRGTDVKD